MSYELIHTSAQRGLRPGSRGFTTVAMTDGLPPLWRERLESLSAYEAPSQGSDLPVLYAHLTCKVAGASSHVLSRVGPCGLDYSGRSNRIAHHLLVEASECPAAGPAWLLQQPDLFRERWDEEPQIFPFGPKIASGDEPARACTAWQQVTGDAGWAGRLVQSLREQPSLPSYIIYPPGTNALPLIREAIALMPVQERWQVTFSTYFGHLPSDTTCAWRCVLAGSAAARGTGRPDVLVIDLTSDLSRAPDNEFTEVARAGQTIPARAPTAVRESKSAATLVAAGDGRAIAPASVTAPDDGEYGLEAVGRVRVADQRVHIGGGSDAASDDELVTPRQSRTKTILAWTGWLCAAAIAIAFGLLAFQENGTGVVPDENSANVQGSGVLESSVSQSSTDVEPATGNATSDPEPETGGATDTDVSRLQDRISQLETKLAEEISGRNEENRATRAAQTPVKVLQVPDASTAGVLVASISVVDMQQPHHEINGRSLSWTLFAAKHPDTQVIASSEDTKITLLLEELTATGFGDPQSSLLATVSFRAAGESAVSVKVDPAHLTTITTLKPDAALVLTNGHQWLAIHTGRVSDVRELAPTPDQGVSSSITFEFNGTEIPERIHLLAPWAREGDAWRLQLDGEHALYLIKDSDARRITVDLKASDAFPSREEFEQTIEDLREEAQELEEGDDRRGRRLGRRLAGIATVQTELLADAPIVRAVEAANELPPVVLYDELGRPWRKLRLQFEAWRPLSEDDPEPKHVDHPTPERRPAPVKKR